VPHVSLCLLYDIWINKIISISHIHRFHPVTGSRAPASIWPTWSRMIFSCTFWPPILRGMSWQFHVAEHGDVAWSLLSYSLVALLCDFNDFNPTKHKLIHQFTCLQFTVTKIITYHTWTSTTNHGAKTCLWATTQKFAGDWALSLFNEPCNWRKDFPKLPHPKTTNYETMIFGEVVAVGDSSRNNPK